jgi:hypothetical protein
MTPACDRSCSGIYAGAGVVPWVTGLSWLYMGWPTLIYMGLTCMTLPLPLLFAISAMTPEGAEALDLL